MIDGNFSSISTIGIRTRYFNFSTPNSVWKCTWVCEIDNCTIFQSNNLGINRIYSNCEGNVIDLNSRKFN